MKRLFLILCLVMSGCGTEEYHKSFEKNETEPSVVFSNTPYAEEDEFSTPSPLPMPLIEEIMGMEEDDWESRKEPENLSAPSVTEEERVSDDELTEEKPDPELESVEKETVAEDVAEDEQLKINNLRTAIYAGLDIGRYVYLEEVSLRLQNLGIFINYEDSFAPQWTMLESEDCPFIKYYDNKPTVDELLCEYLLDAAKAEVYSELIDILDSLPMPAEIEEQYMEEALFWFEQGAISGIEENRVMIRNDFKLNNVCNQAQAPTVAESAYDKGVIEGRQHFINHFNTWLDKNGYIPDYPAMSQPIEVCNADVSMLDPARKDALKSISSALEENPLCEDFEPTTLEMQAQYAQANIDYSNALKAGVENEFALAAVKVFKVIPCNVSDPLIIDLDGDGFFDITPIEKGVNFDLHSEGRKQAIAWLGVDGFLFHDRNKNGIVDSGLEFFGNMLEFADGFEHMAFYDDNQDGILSSADAEFKYMGIWQDANGDGSCTKNEVLSMDDAGVQAFMLSYSSFGSISGGSHVKYISYALVKDAEPFLVGDAFLQSAVYARLER